MKKKAYSRGTDSVPALLTPHEAVLNRKAADLLGREKIKKLNAKGNAMERYQRGTSDVGRDDRADLLKDAENTFYGGGNAPTPTPTPTPKPRGYQYGTSNVQRGIDYASSPMASPTGAQGFGGSPTAQMGGSPGNLSTNSIPYGGSGGGITYTGAPGGFNTGGAPTYTGSPGGFPTGGTTYPYGYQPSGGPSGTNPNINVTAGSKGVSPLSAPVPDLRYADPSTLGRLDISNLIYSFPQGGYIHPDRAVNDPYYKGGNPAPGSPLSYGGGGDPNANRAASAYYNYIGGLPTMPRGTPALNQLYNATGTSPSPGTPLNSTLGKGLGDYLHDVGGYPGTVWYPSPRAR